MHENNFEGRLDESAEQEKPPFELLGKVTLIRHGHTEYTEQYPDITDIGAQQIEEQATRLKETIDPDKEDILLAASPSMRAQGSADVLKETLGAGEVRVMRALRGVELRDRTEALRMIQDIIGPDKDISKMDRAYAHDETFEKRVDVWEPRSEVEKRFFRGMEYVVRAFTKYGQTQENKIPHFIGVSHFEPLNHLVARAFQLDERHQDQLKFAEMIEMALLRRGTEEDRQRISILITFRGKTKEIVFNRESRSIESIKEQE